MSIFPGNVLIVDDQFNICYQDRPEDLPQQIQYDNFVRLRNLFDDTGIPFSVISDTKNIGDIISRIDRYQNVRLLILDLDLDESGDIEEDTDIATIKAIILKSIHHFGYCFLAINSSYAEKWEDIKKSFLDEWTQQPEKFQREIHFLNNFCISINKSLVSIQDDILKLLTDKFSNELITQFECYINAARDKVLGGFFEYTSQTWESLYKTLKEDIDSKEHVNFTLNSFLVGLLKQYIVNVSYSVPLHEKEINDENLHKDIIRGFNYLHNNDKILDSHPVWTGNLYKVEDKGLNKQYALVITPECDIAQGKSFGYTVVYGFEISEETLPEKYNPDDYKETEPPLIAKLAGMTKDKKWKNKNDIEKIFKDGLGYYPLLHASQNRNHIIIDLRTVEILNEFPANSYTLLLRINEPIITDITDKFSTIYNRKGIPRLVSKKFKLLK